MDHKPFPGNELIGRTSTNGLVDTETLIVGMLSQLGKTGQRRLEDTAYILQNIGAPLEGEYYKIGAHGYPYSFDFRLKLDEMIDFGYVAETCDEKRREDVFSLNNEHKYVQATDIAFLDPYKDVLQYVNKQSIEDLDIVGKIFFLKEHQDTKDSLVMEKLEILHPSVEPRLNELLLIYRAIRKGYQPREQKNKVHAY